MSTSLLSVLSTCFWICLVFTIFFFLLSVVLFFVFDIKSIFNAKTGRAQAKTLKEMKAANESTGRLRVDGKTQTSKLTKEEIEAGREPLVVPPTEKEKEEFYSAPNESDGSEDTAILTQPQDQQPEQQPIQPEPQPIQPEPQPIQPEPQPVRQSDETMVLTPEYNETSVLTQEMTDALGSDNSEKRVEMRIIKKEMYLHTNEIIA